MDLSVIIVSYNTADLTINTIKSVFETTHDIQYEIIVVDNDSKDDSVKLIREEFGDKVNLIVNNDNLGFSKANNIAIKESKGDYILILNSDTIVHKNTINRSLDYIKKYSEIGALGCKIVLRDGNLDKACKRGFPTPWNSFCYALKLDKLFPENKKFGGYNLTYLSEDEINEVDCLMGAYMILRREVIDKVGLLDEDFFMYGEDIDWCYRIKENQWKIVYYPEVSITHYKKASFAKKRTKTIIEFYKSMFIFYNKHYIKKYNFIITIVVYIGISLQLVLALIKNLFKF